MKNYPEINHEINTQVYKKLKYIKKLNKVLNQGGSDNG